MAEAGRDVRVQLGVVWAVEVSDQAAVLELLFDVAVFGAVCGVVAEEIAAEFGVIRPTIYRPPRLTARQCWLSRPEHRGLKAAPAVPFAGNYGLGHLGGTQPRRSLRYFASIDLPLH